MRAKHLIVALGLAAVPASAQSPNYGYSSTETTGTIASTGVYQQVFFASSRGVRGGCLIQNKGSSGGLMLVVLSPTQPTSNSGVGFQIQAPTTTNQGGSFSCGMIGGASVLDAIWIEGTAADSFEASSQP